VRSIGAGFEFSLCCLEHSDPGSIAIFLTASVDVSRPVASVMASAASETSILDLPPVPPRARKIRQMEPIGRLLQRIP
jgi:hypothetical protein